MRDEVDLPIEELLKRYSGQKGELITEAHLFIFLGCRVDLLKGDLFASGKECHVILYIVL